MRAWARRTSELHAELSAIADVDPRWWLVAGGAAAAEPLPARAAYVASDADPGTDTFIGVRAPEPADWIAEAIARAHAARLAVRELDGKLPDQPLSVTVRRDRGARTVASTLEVAAFALGDRVILARLADDIADERALANRLLAATSGPPERPTDPVPAPFVCISIGDEPISVARHGHRRAWVDGQGPWLGLSRSGGLATVSTCHMVIDGYGHAWLTSRILEHHARLAPRAPRATSLTIGASSIIELPNLRRLPEAIMLGVAWRELPQPSPRALPLGYALGRVLHRAAKRPRATFSPTFQIPVLPGEPEDPERRFRRVVPSAMSVRFADGVPEPYEAFEARARAILAREASAQGLCTRLLAAARAAPGSVAWKRKTFSTGRPGWLDRIAEVVGGRASLSRINLDVRLPPACAASSPARIASKTDPLGACVITILDDGTHSAITACGSGLAGTPDDAADLIDVLLELL